MRTFYSFKKGKSRTGEVLKRLQQLRRHGRTTGCQVCKKKGFNRAEHSSCEGGRNRSLVFVVEKQKVCGFHDSSKAAETHCYDLWHCAKPQHHNKNWRRKQLNFEKLVNTTKRVRHFHKVPFSTHPNRGICSKWQAWHVTSLLTWKNRKSFSGRGQLIEKRKKNSVEQPGKISKTRQYSTATMAKALRTIHCKHLQMTAVLCWNYRNVAHILWNTVTETQQVTNRLCLPIRVANALATWFSSDQVFLLCTPNPSQRAKMPIGPLIPTSVYSECI